MTAMLAAPPLPLTDEQRIELERIAGPRGCRIGR
jgi:hypothetical protein